MVNLSVKISHTVHCNGCARTASYFFRSVCRRLCTSRCFAVCTCTTWKGRSHAIGSCSLAFLYCDPIAWRMWPASVTAWVPAAVDHPCQLFFFLIIIIIPYPRPPYFLCCFRTDHGNSAASTSLALNYPHCFFSLLTF